MVLGVKTLQDEEGLDRAALVQTMTFFSRPCHLPRNLVLFCSLCSRFQHKETKKADPLTLMTMCFKEVGAVSSARPILDNLVVGMSKVKYPCVTIVVVDACIIAHQRLLVSVLSFFRELLPCLFFPA